MLIFADLRFEHHFKSIYIWDAANDVYNKGWRLNMETIAGPALTSRSKIECSITCRGIANCTGVDYVTNELLCQTYNMQNINLP